MRMDAAAVPSDEGSEMKQESPAKRVSARVLALFSLLACGIAASRYSAHPILVDISRDLHSRPRHISSMVSLNQLGTVFGLILIVPLADGRNQRKLVALLLLCASAAICGIAAAPSVTVLLVMSFCGGIALSVHHILTSWAVGIAPANQSGRVIGWMHSGTVAGTLTGIVFAGATTLALSWRAVFWSFGAVLFLSIPILGWLNPPTKAIQRESWLTLVKSTAGLLRDPALRNASLLGGLMFCAYHIVWLSLVFMLRMPPYHYTSLETGFFAIIGLTGVIVSPLAGRWMDRFSGTVTLAWSLSTIAAATVVLLFAANSIAFVIVGLILLDIGVRSAQVSAQARIYKINRIDYARATTVYMIVYLLGGSIGSYISSVVWQAYGWRPVCFAALAALVLAMIVLFRDPVAQANTVGRSLLSRPANSDSVAL
jgi:predicted MFS family arabinose efflux permease